VPTFRDDRVAASHPPSGRRTGAGTRGAAAGHLGLPAGRLYGGLSFIPPAFPESAGMRAA